MRDTDVPMTEDFIAIGAMFAIGTWSLTSRKSVHLKEAEP